MITEEGLPVRLPSGAVYTVMTQAEVEYVEDRTRRYLEDNHFVNVSDLQDVDRMLMMEVLSFRWSLWISTGRDYFGEPIDDNGYRRSLNDYSGEVRQLKKTLGIDKVARDKQKGEDSVSAYLEQLRVRAKEFGIMREEQCSKAIQLAQDLRALMTLHDNSDEKERAELHCDTEDVLDWIRTVFDPEFEKVDEYFRSKQPDGQRYWVRQM